MYNLSDYFANRKLFKLDNKGKSPAFFLKKKNYKLNKFAIKKLKEFSTNNNKYFIFSFFHLGSYCHTYTDRHTMTE